ncbi:hypothetical protein [Streptomyces jumonjinensis]|uniref:Rpn family recombination-promoting nuclease/putative transposase n=1 Tax=Streptomyces jumonjinensis TaxID=1945 RepID=A0A646KNZ1_STRJU|nr:hypothetical protein [Streptomyces jumonjinensis]MQT04039.1 hypothetical protein [Streptomyces jumonjinensis]
MVSSPHEAMHRIFQEYPELFTGVSRILGLDFAPPASVTVLPTDLTEARPVERRVDTLLRFDTEDGDSFLLAVEAQGKKDPAKPASWAYYLSYLYAKYQLPPLLLVVCQDRATAEWASRPVTIGPGQWPALTLRPLVAGPHNMPVITDPAQARKDLAMATLSAITHAADPSVDGILKALSTALRDTPETIAHPIVELTAQGLGTRPAAQQWRKLVAVDLSFFTSPMSEELRDEGRAEVRAEVLPMVAEAILMFLEQRGIDIPDDARERITSCDDPETMHHWLTRSATAPSAEAIFDQA